MPFDLVPVATALARLSSKGIPVAAAVTKLYLLYQKLEPATKASIQADVDAIAASWAALDTALNNYKSADDFSKISAVEAIIATIGTLAPLIGKIAKDGQTLFGADWPLIKPQLDIIVNTLKGTTP
jgi:hypothetical protein